MLENDAARELYHEHAARMPIIDYHCHLVPQMIAENRRFGNITEAWLGGDHYKWRAMRATTNLPYLLSSEISAISMFGFSKSNTNSPSFLGFYQISRVKSSKVYLSKIRQAYFSIFHILMDYLEYNSTISISFTGTSISSLVGSSLTVPRRFS